MKINTKLNQQNIKMLMNRLHEPSADDIIYHYCSAETLRSILESKKIRFSDINMLNDSNEYIWGYRVFEIATTRLIKREGVRDDVPTINEAFFDAVDEIISKIQWIAHPFVACFSRSGDSLSQWRAYADDGRGFAIGFRSQALKQLPVTLLSIEYEQDAQAVQMMAALLSIFKRCKGDINQSNQTFFEDCILLGTYMISLKHPAFKEEQEIRCVRAVNINQNENSIRFVDPGGHNEEGDVFEGKPVSFHVRNNHLSAYLDLPFWSEGKPHPIAKIMLGPKNHSDPINIFLYLGGLGYSSVEIEKSSAPYR